MPHPILLTSPLPAKHLRFESMTASEGLSVLGEMQLTLVSPKRDLAPEDLLGQPVSVCLSFHDDHKRYLHGYVTRFAMGRNRGRYYGYRATVRPWLWFLTRTTDCRIFQGQSVPDIVKTVFEDHGVANFEFKLYRSYSPWNYCVQYRESDFNFVARLLEHEGIYWYFEHGESSHKLVLVDSNSAHDSAAECESLPFVETPDGQAPNHDLISAWTFEREVRTGKVATTSYDFERPSADLAAELSTSRAHDLGDYELFDYQGDYTQLAQGEHWAENRLDEHQHRHESLRGTSNAQGLSCGYVLEMSGHPRTDQNGKYLVTGTQLSAHQATAEADSGDHHFSCDFRAIPLAQQYRPPRRMPKPFMQGPQTALVVGPAGEEIYTDKYGRVKVQFHWDRRGTMNEKSSCWIRVSQPWAGKNFGMVAHPRIGQEVVVSFLEGDPDQPLITGRVYNAEQMPPWEMPAAATQTGILTRSSKGGTYSKANALRFEDKEGSEAIWIQAEKDMSVVVENDQSTNVAHDQSTNIGNKQTVYVKKGRVVFVETEGESYTVKGPKRSIYVDAVQEQVVVHNHNLWAQANMGEYVTGDREAITTGKLIIQATNAYHDSGPLNYLHATDLKFKSDAATAFEAGAGFSVKAANFKFAALGNFNFSGNKFERLVLENNDTVLGANTNTYIGASRDVAMGPAVEVYSGIKTSTAGGLAFETFMGLQLSTALSLSISNAVSISMNNALMNMGMTGMDISMNGIGMEQNSFKMLNGGAGSGAGGAAMLSANASAISVVLAALGFVVGGSLGAAVAASDLSRADQDVESLLNSDQLTPAVKARLTRALANRFSPQTAEGYSAEIPQAEIDAQTAHAAEGTGVTAPSAAAANPPAAPAAPAAPPHPGI